MQLVLSLYKTFGINNANYICVRLMQLLTVISTIDDLNYPEKTDTYYIVNVPYVFSACWKVCAYINSYRSILNILSISERKRKSCGSKPSGGNVNMICCPC